MEIHPSVSVVVLNYNDLEDTRSCINSLLKTKYLNYEIVVVDNGSRINEANILKKTIKNKKIKIYRFKKNYGFTGGNNRIVGKLKSKYIVFLNNDTKVSQTWLGYLVSFMEKNKNAAICQSKILLMDDSSHFDYAGGCGGFIDKYGYPFTRGRIFFTSEKNKGQYDYISKIFWSSGAAMIIRKKTFVDIGMFDDSFFLYMEEIDLCWRLLQKGYDIVSVPASIVYHKVAASAKKNMFTKRYYEHRNNLIMLAKNYSTHDLLLFFPQRILLEFVTMSFYLLRGDLISCFALAKAHIDFWILLPKLLVKRPRTQKDLKTFSNLVYNRSIVFDYFILKRNFFSLIKM